MDSKLSKGMVRRSKKRVNTKINKMNNKMKDKKSGRLINSKKT